MTKIVSAIPNDDHTLAITLNNSARSSAACVPGCSRCVSERPADLERFKAVRVEHGNTLVWDRLCRIAIDEIINMIER